MIPVWYVSSGFFHPSWLNRRRLHALLAESPAFDIREAPSLERLPAGAWQAARAVVLYFHARRISPAALERLEAFVSDGGGLLAVHSAAASFKSEARYHALLGGRFSGHGPVERFSVQSLDTAESAFSLREPFGLRDERYLHETRADIQVHYVSSSGGQAEPFVWTRRQGAGRVCYCAAGHTLASLRHPAVRRILVEGLGWVAGGVE